jgi:putative peptide zinc metalloprotease protein
MPFDGTLLTLHLKEKTSTYLAKGQPFAMAENTGQVTAEVDVPEADIRYVAQSTRVRARAATYGDEVFQGTVKTIDGNVTRQSFGNVVKVVALIDNQEGRLKTGMTGYAKIEGPSLPAWNAFSLGLLRFFNIQVWSWVP